MSQPVKIGGTGNTWTSGAIHSGSGAQKTGAPATVGGTGALQGNSVQQLATPQAPGQRSGIGHKVADFFQHALPSFFKGVGRAILKTCLGETGASARAAPSPSARAPATTAPATAVAQPVVRSFGENRTALQNLLPKGVTVDDRGIISGTYHPTKFADKFAGDQKGKAITDVANQSAKNALTPKTDKALPTISGIPVAPQATSDFFRLNLTVHNGTDTFTSRGDAETIEAKRNENVMNAVHSLTGDAKTSTVLSTVLNQQFSRYLLETMETASGDQATFSPLAPRDGQIAIRADDGSETRETPQGIGGAPMSLSKMADGNYKVEVSWDNLFKQSGRGFDKADLPGMGDTAIKATGRLEFVIDGEAAKRGELVVTMPTPASMTFSGRMAPQT